MSTAVALPPQAPARPADPAAARPRHALGFLLFLVVNAALFVRPAEVVPALVGWNIYEFLILACLAASFPAVLEQFRAKSLEDRPVTVCLLGLFLAIILSHLAQLDLANAWFFGLDFLKVVLYYMLFVGLVDSVARMRTFLFWTAVFGTVTLSLAVLQYHGVITLPNLKQIGGHVQDVVTGRDTALVRLTGSGIFGDPNELGVLAAVLVVLVVYWLTDRRCGAARFLWLGPLALFLYAVTLTQSRGALLALVAGVVVLLVARFGWRTGLLAGVVAASALLLLAAGRQAELSTGNGTAQDRIQIWSDALVTMREAPLFGVGRDMFAKREGLVAHNSYLQCFVELGVFGGMLFVGAWYLAVSRLLRLGDRRRHAPLDPEAARLHPVVLGAVAGWAVGMLSLTLCYILPTYTLLALATAYTRAAPADPPLPPQRFDLRLLGRLAVVAVGGFLVLYLFVRLSLVR
jgi:O-antigen ligase